MCVHCFIFQEDLRDFFNRVMAEAQGSDRNPGDSVLSVYINHARRFAFAEFRTMEEATAAMALDGISYQGESLKVPHCSCNFSSNPGSSVCVEQLMVSSLASAA